MHFALAGPEAQQLALDAVDEPTDPVAERIEVEPTGTLTDVIPNDNVSTSAASQGVAAIGGIGEGGGSPTGAVTGTAVGHTGGHGGLRFETVSRLESASSTHLRPMHFSANATT